MKLFKCRHCDQLLYFENTQCERCKRRLGYLPEAGLLSALELEGDVWRPLAGTGDAVPGTRRFCDNALYDACNWLLPAGSADRFCAACRHNRMIPDLTGPDNMLRWQKLEDAKHRLFYTLLRLRLPLVDRRQDPGHGLMFDFLADAPDPNGPTVMTGHDNGLVTIALAEADDAERERRRSQMHEPYRTLLGHFRHEVGHYFWDVLVRDGHHLDECRAIFGDDRQDYAEALQRHYKTGAPPDWRDRFVSSYASTHPWEDWAETWAHYLHIVDTLETAGAFGLAVHPAIAAPDEMRARVDFDPYETTDVETLVQAWLPLCLAMNSINRSMGQPDLYPFVLSPGVIGKLGFVHKMVRAGRNAGMN